MADITVTVAEVEPVYSFAVPPSLETRIAGATITAGQPLYADTTTQDYKGRPKLKLCDANASAASALCYGIALHAALLDQPITVIKAGALYLGAVGGSVLTEGVGYNVSATAGGIAPEADLITGTDWYNCRLGVADTTAILRLNAPFTVSAAVNA